MLPEWGRFVMAVKLNRVPPQPSYIPPVPPQPSYIPPVTYQPYFTDNTQLDTGFYPADELLDNLTKQVALLAQQYKTQFPQTNNQLRTSSNTRNQDTMQNRGDRTRFKETLLGVLLLKEMGELSTELVMQILGKESQSSVTTAMGLMYAMQAQENEVDLDEEQLLFLAGGQPNTFDDEVDEGPVQDIAQNEDNIFQADQCDAFDSDIDEALTAQTMFMANLSSADLVYDEAGPSYDSDTLSEAFQRRHNKHLSSWFKNRPSYAYQRRTMFSWTSRLTSDAKSRPKLKVNLTNPIMKVALCVPRCMNSEPGPCLRHKVLNPEDIYAAVDSCETAQEIWLRVQQMMKGSNIGIQEKKAKLFNEWKVPKTTYNQRSPTLPTFHQTKGFAYDRLQLIVNDFLKYNTKRRLLKPEYEYGQDRPDADRLELMVGISLDRMLGECRESKWYNAVQNVGIRVFNARFRQQGFQNVGNQNGQIVVPGITNQNPNGNGNVVAARAEGNATGNNVRPRRRDAAYLQTQLLIAQKEEAGIQLQAEEFDLMAAAADLDEIEEVNANCILMANLQQASTSGTQTDNAPVYDSDGSAEVHNYDNCYDNEIFNMFTQEEQYTELLEPIPEPHQEQQNDSNVISDFSSVEQEGGTVDQHPATVEETRAYFESLYNNLALEVEKVNSVNQKMKETNADLTTELARYKNQEKCFEISQEKYDKLERCYQKSVYQEQCLTKKINALHLSSGKQITTLNEEISNLSKQLSTEKSTVSSLLEEKKKLKSDFKIREDELLDKQIQLENKIKELDNILVKTGQSIQTMHMLSPKPDSFYHTEQKMALGYQNPFYLKQAQRKQQSLYNGKVLLEKHDPPVVHDSEETLQLAQESRQKMKQLNKEIKPANYTKINHLSGIFVSQTAKSQEEVYFVNTSKTATVSKSISIPNEKCCTKQLNKEIKPANYTKINHLSGVFVSQTAKSQEEVYFVNTSKTATVSKSISIPNEEFLDDTTPSVARKFLNESSSAHQEIHKIIKDEIFPIFNQVDAKVQNFKIQFLKEEAKFVRDFKSLAKEADESLIKHKALELEIERLLRVVVSQDIMSIVQNLSVADSSNLQTELDRTKERFENCIIKNENEYAKLWNDWYKKCEECKYDKILYDKAYNDMQHKIEQLQAQLGDQKGKSKDTPCVSNTLDPLSQKLENKNVE
ncbi:hypothetical protein Tco_1321532 [Tanacetum coccineum]